MSLSTIEKFESGHKSLRYLLSCYRSIAEEGDEVKSRPSYHIHQLLAGEAELLELPELECTDTDEADEEVEEESAAADEDQGVDDAVAEDEVAEEAPPPKVRKKRDLTQEQRDAAAERMREMWRKRRAKADSTDRDFSVEVSDDDSGSETLSEIMNG